MTLLLALVRPRLRPTRWAWLAPIPLVLSFACGGDPGQDGSGGSSSGGSASGGEGPTSGGDTGSGGNDDGSGGEDPSSGGSDAGGSDTGGTGTGGASGSGALDLERVETARKLKRRISMGETDHAGCIVTEAGGIECRGADDRDETFDQPVDLVAYSGLGYCVILDDATVQCDLATSVSADDVDFADSIGSAGHLVKDGADGLLAIGVDGDVRAWTGSMEVTAPAPAGSLLGGSDAEVCTLAPDGHVACFWYNSLIEEAVDKSPFAFDTTAYVELDQSLSILGAIRDDGVLTINHKFEDEPVEYTELQVQVSTDSDFWCMISNTGTVSCDHYAGASIPGGILDVPNGEFLAVDVNEDSACAVRPTGEVVCWGTNAPTFDSLVRLD